MKPITCVLIVLVVCQLYMATSASKASSEEDVEKVRDMAKQMGSNMMEKANGFVKKIKDIAVDKRAIADKVHL